MSWKNKIVWSEGLFLRPQHFQQQERYLDRLVDQRVRSLKPNGWGLSRLEIDRDLLEVGKFALRAAEGLFADGTPFSFPGDDLLPEAIDVTENVRDQRVFLAIPVARPGGMDSRGEQAVDEVVRYRRRDVEVRDNTTATFTAAMLEVAAIDARLLFENELTDDYVAIPVARIKECRVDKHVVLSDDFIPSVLKLDASNRLLGMINEVKGMLSQRADALAARAVASGRGGTAEIGDFLKLQILNRYEPLMVDYLAQRSDHPQALFRSLLELTGELATFSSSDRRAPEFPPYRQHDLWSCFEPTLTVFRQLMSDTDGQSAVNIPVQERQYGIRVAPLADKSLLEHASFVLAVSADVDSEQLRGNFPKLVKIGPVERIHELVNSQIPGIGLTPLAVTPRQIPYHAGFVYFELSRGNTLWQAMPGSAGFAFHVGGSLPSLEIEFWAIRTR